MKKDASMSIAAAALSVWLLITTSLLIFTLNEIHTVKNQSETALYKSLAEKDSVILAQNAEIKRLKEKPALFEHGKNEKMKKQLLKWIDDEYNTDCAIVVKK